MPIVGNDRKANPLAVWQACEKEFGDLWVKAVPKPRPSETFTAYMGRLQGTEFWREEAIFFALIVLGATTDGKDEPNRRDYLRTLDNAADSLYRARKALFEAWPR